MEGCIGLHIKGTKYYSRASIEQVNDYGELVLLTVYAKRLEQIGLSGRAVI